MAVILSTLLTTYILLLMVQECAKKTLSYLLISVEAYFIVLFLSTKIILRPRNVSESLAYSLKIFNKFILSVIYTLLLFQETALLAYYSFNMALGYVPASKELYTYTCLNTYFLTVLYVNIDEYDYFHWSFRTMLMWIVNCAYYIHYANTSDDSGCLSAPMRSLFFKRAITIGLVLYLLIRSTKTFKYILIKKVL